MALPERYSINLHNLLIYLMCSHLLHVFDISIVFVVDSNHAQVISAVSSMYSSTKNLFLSHLYNSAQFLLVYFEQTFYPLL